MRRRHLLSLAIGVAIPALAVADVGRPTSFSVTISRAPGTINTDLLVTTQNPVNPLSPDAVAFNFVVFRGGLPVPTFVASYSGTVQRGSPTTNRQFAASFSIAVPDEHQPFKYLALVLPYGVSPSTPVPSSRYAEVLSFLTSALPDVNMRYAPTPAAGPRWFFWARGQQQYASNVPALSLWGLGALGALLAAAGALLVRRS